MVRRIGYEVTDSLIDAVDSKQPIHSIEGSTDGQNRLQRSTESTDRLRRFR